MEKITQNYLQKWEKMNNLTWYPELRNYTFDIACSLLVSTENASQTPLAEYFTEKLKQMTYLEQVLKEVLRLVPPVGGGFRRVINAFEFNGYYIPEGWTIQYQITETHKDREIYQNYQDFAPERFSPTREEDKKKNFGYVPFGGGLRECLGKEFARLEMRIFASLLVQKYA